MYKLEFQYRGIRNLDKFIPMFQEQVRRSMRIFGAKGANRIAREIRQGSGYDKNSLPWSHYKGSNKPLYHTGFMSMAPSYKVTVRTRDPILSVQIGFLTRRHHPSGGGPLQKIVNILTTGARWTPSDAARRAFWYKVKKSLPDDFKPVKKDVWEIPKRDFLTKALGQDMVSLFEYYARQAEKRTIAMLK